MLSNRAHCNFKMYAHSPRCYVKATLMILFTILVVDVNAEVRQRDPGKEIVQITPCPNSPNCVSSMDQFPDHKVEPLRYKTSADEAIAKLRKIVEAMPRANIVQSSPHYLRVEVKSAIFRFVDDLELLAGEGPGVIHIRSASRVGYWDLGVNRRRVERIRAEFAQTDE